MKRDKIGNIIRAGTRFGNVLYGYVRIFDKDFNLQSDFYTTDITSIWSFNISPENEIWIATNKGLLRSKDGNKSYQTVSFLNINTTAITFTDNGEVWVSTQEGIFKSANQGKN
ncbi:MAG TPA: hypothetical protein PLO56_00145 [Rhodothermales bacterium]|nr:hypothetical protein [Rhodothermales bacterium]